MAKRRMRRLHATSISGKPVRSFSGISALFPSRILQASVLRMLQKKTMPDHEKLFNLAVGAFGMDPARPNTGLFLKKARYYLETGKYPADEGIRQLVSIVENTKEETRAIAAEKVYHTLAELAKTQEGTIQAMIGQQMDLLFQAMPPENQNLIASRLISESLDLLVTDPSGPTAAQHLEKVAEIVVKITDSNMLTAAICKLMGASTHEEETAEKIAGCLLDITRGLEGDQRKGMINLISEHLHENPLVLRSKLADSCDIHPDGTIPNDEHDLLVAMLAGLEKETLMMLYGISNSFAVRCEVWPMIEELEAQEKLRSFEASMVGKVVSAAEILEKEVSPDGALARSKYYDPKEFMQEVWKNDFLSVMEEYPGSAYTDQMLRKLLNDAIGAKINPEKVEYAVSLLAQALGKTDDIGIKKIALTFIELFSKARRGMDIRCMDEVMEPALAKHEDAMADLLEAVKDDQIFYNLYDFVSSSLSEENFNRVEKRRKERAAVKKEQALESFCWHLVDPKTRKLIRVTNESGRTLGTEVGDFAVELITENIRDIKTALDYMRSRIDPACRYVQDHREGKKRRFILFLPDKDGKSREVIEAESVNTYSRFLDSFRDRTCSEIAEVFGVINRIAENKDEVETERIRRKNRRRSLSTEIRTFTEDPACKEASGHLDRALDTIAKMDEGDKEIVLLTVQRLFDAANKSKGMEKDEVRENVVHALLQVVESLNEEFRESVAFNIREYLPLMSPLAVRKKMIEMLGKGGYTDAEYSRLFDLAEPGLKETVGLKSASNQSVRMLAAESLDQLTIDDLPRAAAEIPESEETEILIKKVVASTIEEPENMQRSVLLLQGAMNAPLNLKEKLAYALADISLGLPKKHENQFRQLAAPVLWNESAHLAPILKAMDETRFRILFPMVENVLGEKERREIEQAKAAYTLFKIEDGTLLQVRAENGSFSVQAVGEHAFEVITDRSSDVNDMMGYIGENFGAGFQLIRDRLEGNKGRFIIYYPIPPGESTAEITPEDAFAENFEYTTNFHSVPCSDIIEIKLAVGEYAKAKNPEILSACLAGFSKDPAGPGASELLGHALQVLSRMDRANPDYEEPILTSMRKMLSQANRSEGEQKEAIKENIASAVLEITASLEGKLGENVSRRLSGFLPVSAMPVKNKIVEMLQTRAGMSEEQIKCAFRIACPTPAEMERIRTGSPNGFAKYLVVNKIAAWKDEFLFFLSRDPDSSQAIKMLGEIVKYALDARSEETMTEVAFILKQAIEQSEQNEKVMATVEHIRSNSKEKLRKKLDSIIPPLIEEEELDTDTPLPIHVEEQEAEPPLVSQEEEEAETPIQINVAEPDAEAVLAARQMEDTDMSIPIHVVEPAEQFTPIHVQEPDEPVLPIHTEELVFDTQIETQAEAEFAPAHAEQIEEPQARAEDKSGGISPALTQVDGDEEIDFGSLHPKHIVAIATEKDSGNAVILKAISQIVERVHLEEDKPAAQSRASIYLFGILHGTKDEDKKALVWEALGSYINADWCCSLTSYLSSVSKFSKMHGLMLDFLESRVGIEELRILQKSECQEISKRASNLMLERFPAEAQLVVAQAFQKAAEGFNKVMEEKRLKEEDDELFYKKLSVFRENPNSLISTALLGETVEELSNPAFTYETLTRRINALVQSAQEADPRYEREAKQKAAYCIFEILMNVDEEKAKLLEGRMYESESIKSWSRDIYMALESSKDLSPAEQRLLGFVWPHLDDGEIAVLCKHYFEILVSSPKGEKAERELDLYKLLRYDFPYEYHHRILQEAKNPRIKEMAAKMLGDIPGTVANFINPFYEQEAEGAPGEAAESVIVDPTMPVEEFQDEATPVEKLVPKPDQGQGVRYLVSAQERLNELAEEHGSTPQEIEAAVLNMLNNYQGMENLHDGLVQAGAKKLSSTGFVKVALELYRISLTDGNERVEAAWDLKYRALSMGEELKSIVLDCLLNIAPGVIGDDDVKLVRKRRPTLLSWIFKKK